VFALTGEEIFLVHYQEIRDSSIQDGRDLRLLTADNASQQRRLETFDAETRAAIAFADSVISKRRRERVYPGARDALDLERHLENIRAISQKLYDEESRLLIVRKQKSQSDRLWTKTIAVTGNLLGSVLWMLTWLGVRREIRNNSQTRNQLNLLNAELENRVEQRTQALRTEVEERTREQEISGRLAAIVESSEDAIISKTLEGVITAWNRGAEKLFGYTSSEALGKSMRMLIPPQRMNEEPEILMRIGRGDSVEHFETIRMRKDGTFLDVSVAISPIKDRSGTIIGASNVARDITDRKRADEALRKSLATIELAFKSLAEQKYALDQHAIVAITDVQGAIIYVNEKFCTLSQYSEKELIGQNHRILNSGQHTTAFFQQMYSTVARGKVWHGEIRNRAKDGSFYWVDTTIVPFMTDDGKPRQYLAIRADITERKRVEAAFASSQQDLEAKSLTLRSVLDSMTEGLVAADENGKFILWNAAADKIVGMTAADVKSENWSQYYGIFLPDMVTPFPIERHPLAQAIQGKTSTALMYLRNAANPEGLWLEVSGNPLKENDGSARGGVVAFRDVTQSKADEREIRLLTDELEERVIERTAQLRVANQELESFSYSVSHDLRAPLRHIAGFSKMLAEEYGAGLAPGAQHYLDRIQAGTQKMGLLIDELLNLARVGRHSLNRQSARLNPIIADLITILEPDMRGREVKWAVADLPGVECDPVLVRQIFQNLMANALKFTRSRTETVIEICATQKQEDGQPVFTVRDNGIGFNMKYVDKLFGVFQRLHRAEDFEGTGIGLATVQRIVQKHGGEVWAEGEEDRGAAFHFTLGAGKNREAKSDGAKAGG
jgi:PAS domain S-box-containing protein